MLAGRLWVVLAIGFGLGPVRAEEKPAYLFGTTVVDSSGLQGRVYHLQPGADRLPNFQRMEPVGSVYTSSLNVWPQKFDEGFPNISDRFEWFAIQYTGKIWIENAGQYRFSLLSDDGAMLKLNGKVVINNDGIHGPAAVSGSARLTRGVHNVTVEYFQGPRFTVALVLAVAAEGEQWRIFNMSDFKPPKDPEEWKKGKISHVQHQTMP